MYATCNNFVPEFQITKHTLVMATKIILKKLDLHNIKIYQQFNKECIISQCIDGFISSIDYYKYN